MPIVATDTRRRKHTRTDALVQIWFKSAMRVAAEITLRGGALVEAADKLLASRDVNRREAVVPIELE